MKYIIFFILFIFGNTLQGHQQPFSCPDYKDIGDIAHMVVKAKLSGNNLSVADFSTCYNQNDFPHIRLTYENYDSARPLLLVKDEFEILSIENVNELLNIYEVHYKVQVVSGYEEEFYRSKINFVKEVGNAQARYGCASPHGHAGHTKDILFERCYWRE